MGGNTFEEISFGKDARDAFSKAIDEARHFHGHGGYTGTIAEKSSYTFITDTFSEMKKRIKAKMSRVRDEIRAEKAKRKKDRDTFALNDLREELVRLQYANRIKASSGAFGLANMLTEMNDRRIDDKWGPAGCIEIKGKAATELKKRYGLKGKRVKPFLFFGWASS